MKTDNIFKTGFETREGGTENEFTAFGNTNVEPEVFSKGARMWLHVRTYVLVEDFVSPKKFLFYIKVVRFLFVH